MAGGLLLMSSLLGRPLARALEPALEIRGPQLANPPPDIRCGAVVDALMHIEVQGPWRMLFVLMIGLMFALVQSRSGT